MTTANDLRVRRCYICGAEFPDECGHYAHCELFEPTEKQEEDATEIRQAMDENSDPNGGYER